MKKSSNSREQKQFESELPFIKRLSENLLQNVFSKNSLEYILGRLDELSQRRSAVSSHSTGKYPKSGPQILLNRSIRNGKNELPGETNVASENLLVLPEPKWYSGSLRKPALSRVSEQSKEHEEAKNGSDQS
jgi:hypothetical protein